MKNILNKNNVKVILAVVITSLLTGGIVYAATTASQVNYTKQDGTVISVQEALNDLYSGKKDIKVITGENNRDSGVEQITIDRDCDNAVITSGQISLEYAINQTDNFSSVDAYLGRNVDNIGLYYSSNISLKKGDILYIRRDTGSSYGYAIIY